MQGREELLQLGRLRLAEQLFRRADLVLLSKMDLLPHLDVDLPALEDAIARVMPDPRIVRVSARTGEGLSSWVDWLEERLQSVRTARTAR